MKIGLHVTNFTVPGGPVALREGLMRVAEAAETNGFGRLSVMDHLWQIGHNGPPEHEMLEAYTTLGFLAARTESVDLLAWVSAVSYREPGLLAKLVSTLDVLSGGRAWLGIGAGWNVDEAIGLGLPFPPLAERFERLEEALQICLQMWRGDDDAYQGTHYRLGRTLDSPQPLSRPHPPILIGGGGERKTLRLVATYAQACNLFAGDQVPHKLEVLREHCQAVGRDYDEIEKTVMFSMDPGPDGAKVADVLQRLRHYASLGVAEAHVSVPDVFSITPLEIIGREVVPAAADL